MESRFVSPANAEFFNKIGQKQTLPWSAPLMADSFRRRF
jgi:hypothetical protein